MKTKTKQIYSYSVVYEPAEEGGYVAFAPALPGCHTDGDTLEEAEKNIREAIEAYLSSLRKHNAKLPLESGALLSTVNIPVFA